MPEAQPEPVELDFATLLASREEGEKIEIVGDIVTIRVSSDQAAGQFFVFEEQTPPGGGPPPHYHRQAEIFYVLEGSVDFMKVVDGKPTWLEGEPGSVCAIPSMAHHCFRNSGSSESRVLGITTPGGLDDFFRAIGDSTTLTTAPGMQGPPDMERIEAASEKYGVVFL